MRLGLLIFLTTFHLAVHADMSITDPDTVLNLGHYHADQRVHTSSLFILPAKNIGNARSVSLPQMLTGKIPGLLIVPSDFQPGNEVYHFLVRGVNSINYTNPLFIVDGIQDRDITYLDGDDIENITVLKDATCSLYGSKGANGVVFINTKHGLEGKFRLTLKLNQGFSQPVMVPHLADAASYASIRNEENEYVTGIKEGVYSNAEIQKFRDGSDPIKYPNTDWYNSIYKKVSRQNSIYTSIQGGEKYFNYFASAGTKYQDGVFKNSASNSRLNNFRANLEGKNDFVSLRLNVDYQQQICNAPPFSMDEIFSVMNLVTPTEVDYWPDQKPSKTTYYGYNPVLMTITDCGQSKQISNIFQNSAQLTIDVPFISGLRLNAVYSNDLNNIEHVTDMNPWTLYSWDTVSYVSPGNPLLIPVIYENHNPQTIIQNQINRNTLDADFSYHIDFPIVSAGIAAGFEKQHASNDYTYDYSTDTIFWNYQAYSLDYKSVYYFARLNLKILEHYLLEFTGSLPKSYVLPPKNQSGLFGSVSLGWIISDELFWKNAAGIFNFLKIYGSWGKVGTDNADIHASGLNTDLPNPGFNWETTIKSNIGMEGQLYHGLLSFEFDLFNHINKGIYQNYNYLGPPSWGNDKIRNQGIDYAITFNKSLVNYGIQASFTGSYAKNNVLKYNDLGRPSYQSSIGRPFTMDHSLLYVADGVFHNEEEIAAYPHWTGARPGDIRFRDVNGDHQIDGLDRVRTGKDIIPRFQGGMNINLQYKQFDLSVFIQGAAGGQVYILPKNSLRGNYFNDLIKDRWTSENDQADYPRVCNNFESYWMSNDNTFFLRSTDYIRLKNAEIGYTFKDKILHILKMQDFRIYLRGFNLLTASKLKLTDPEIPWAKYSVGGYPMIRYSYMGYPAARYFDLGLSCSF